MTGQMLSQMKRIDLKLKYLNSRVVQECCNFKREIRESVSTIEMGPGWPELRIEGFGEIGVFVSITENCHKFVSHMRRCAAEF